MFKRILLPIDINDSHSWEETLPSCISMLESTPGAQLWILYVIPNFGMNIVEEYFPAGWKKEVKAKALSELDIIFKSCKSEDIKPTFIIDRGVVYQEILEQATKLEADLIVMSAGNPNNKEYLLGPNVARVTRHADMSVLVSR
jgi:nucleotide-binding universal stress UspA family protein